MSSIDARNSNYFQQRDSGALNTRQRQIMIALHGASEADWSLQEIVRLTGLPINIVSGRVNELKSEGLRLLEESGHRKCSITGRTITAVRIRRGQLNLFKAAA